MTSYIKEKLFREEQNKLIRIRDVMHLTGLSRSYIYSLTADGKFPRSIPLVPGGTARAWLESEVCAWINERVAERDQEV